MSVHLSINAKLVLAASDGKELKSSMEEFNRACNTLSELAFQQDLHRKYDIHHEGYRLIREETSLPAQHVINAIARVSAVYTRDPNKLHQFKPHSSLRYDARTMVLGQDCHTASLTICPKGRITGQLQMSAKMRKQLCQGELGPAELVYRKLGVRLSQSNFHCRDCGYQINADLNGARSIALRHDLVAMGRLFCEYPRKEVNRPGAVRSSEKKRQALNLKPQVPSTARLRA